MLLHFFFILIEDRTSNKFLTGPRLDSIGFKKHLKAEMTFNCQRNVHYFYLENIKFIECTD